MSFAAVICLVAAYEYFRTQSFWDRVPSQARCFPNTRGLCGRYYCHPALWRVSPRRPWQRIIFTGSFHYSVLADLVAMPLMGFCGYAGGHHVIHRDAVGA